MPGRECCWSRGDDGDPGDQLRAPGEAGAQRLPGDEARGEVGDQLLRHRGPRAQDILAEDEQDHDGPTDLQPGVQHREADQGGRGDLLLPGDQRGWSGRGEAPGDGQ